MWSLDLQHTAFRPAAFPELLGLLWVAAPEGQQDVGPLPKQLLCDQTGSAQQPRQSHVKRFCWLWASASPSKDCYPEPLGIDGHSRYPPPSHLELRHHNLPELIRSCHSPMSLWEPGYLLKSSILSGPVINTHRLWAALGPHRQPAGMRSGTPDPLLTNQREGLVSRACFPGFWWASLITLSKKGGQLEGLPLSPTWTWIMASWQSVKLAV